MRSITAFAVLWVALSIAAFLYARDQDIPLALTASLLPAFLLEATLYVCAIHPSTRKRLERSLPGFRLACFLTGTALVPYLWVEAAAGTWNGREALILLALAAAQAFWYLALPAHPAADFLFLILTALPVITRLFQEMYPAPAPQLKLGILGMSMWVRNGVLAVLSLRRMTGIQAGFVPTGREWLVGVLHFVLFVPIGYGIARWLEFVSLRPLDLGVRTLLLTIGTFLGVLWVLALAEEFFFRGLLQQLLRKILHSSVAALCITSVLFGLAHLWFRSFPNWRFALLAGIAGLFYGSAALRTGSIRSAMVTHALVVTLWKIFLR